MTKSSREGETEFRFPGANQGYTSKGARFYMETGCAQSQLLYLRTDLKLYLG